MFNNGEKRYCKKTDSDTVYSDWSIPGGANQARIQAIHSSTGEGWVGTQPSADSQTVGYTCEFTERDQVFAMKCSGGIALQQSADGRYYYDSATETKLCCEHRGGNSCGTQGWKSCYIGSSRYYKGSRSVSINRDVVGSWEARTRTEVGLTF